MRTIAIDLLACGILLSTVALTAQTNGTVTFGVTGGSGLTTQPATISLSVAKQGETEIVTPPPAPGDDQVSGTHTFPVGTGRSTIIQYYRGLLNNAGWTEGTDFTVGAEGINFFVVTKIDSKADKQIKINTSLDSKKLAYEADPPDKRLTFERPAESGQNGQVSILAFGIKWDGATKTITPSLSEVHVAFTASDSAAGVSQKILDSMTADGWTAGLSDGRITITSNGDAANVYTVWISVEYVGQGTNADKWTLDEVN